jgi:predicted dehydrogenase
MSRFLFGREPVRVAALVDRDPEMRVDRLATAILDFAPGQSSFTVSTQMVPYQRTQILGTKGRVEIEIPYNAPPDKPTRIFVDSAVEEFATVDQYMLQGEAFSRAILDGTEVPVSLEDARMNMRVIDAVLKAGETKGWETV